MEILETVLIALQTLCSVAVILVIMFQSGKEAGLSGALAGNTDSYLSKNGGSLDKKLASSTKWIAAFWLILTLILTKVG